MPMNQFSNQCHSKMYLTTANTRRATIRKWDYSAGDGRCSDMPQEKYAGTTLALEITDDRQSVQIDTSKIPAFRKRELAKATLALVDQVFSVPGAEERYQDWLASRKHLQS